MKVSEVSNNILIEVAPKLKHHGFALFKKGREFKRKIGYTTQIFDLFFYKKKDCIIIKPEIRIKIKPIEDIYKAASNIKARPFFTLGNHLMEILRYIDKGEEIGREKRGNWLVEDAEDAQNLIKIIPEYFEEAIIPYFNENSSIARVDEILNKYPKEISIHNWLYPLRACIGIIAAKLNKNSDYEQLLVIYESALEKADKTYKDDFSNIKLKLNQMSEV